MNERIRALNLQAIGAVMNGADPDGDVERMYIPSEFTRKFAELIVRECLEVVEKQFGGGDGDGFEWDRAIDFTYNDVKQYFGIEE